jgi:ornithine cyclodeaminase/alanine dehydrogenase-like protein (mu-crystallin family)
MPHDGTLILTRRDVRETLEMAECVDAVERAFRLYGAGEVPAPAVAAVHVTNGGFHIKAGVLPVGAQSFFVAKTNGNFPGNPARHGLPTIQGTLVVCDADRGTPLAVMDSIEITALRTAAATAVAARYLARKNASAFAIIGCGLQGEMHVRSLSLVRQPSRLILHDINPDAARALAARVMRDFAVPAVIASSPSEAAASADICVTCTPSTEFLLDEDDVPAGAFVAGVGVDSERKRELSPGLLKRSRVVVDVLAQCAAFGDLHHAIEAGVLSADSVDAELGAVVADRKPGRESDSEVIVFDSTGMALLDAAAAALVYERALATGRGTSVSFAD